MDEKTSKKINAFSRDLSEAAGDRLVSLILYGSALTDQFVPGRSDLNFLIVLKSAGEEDLASLIKPVRTWERKGVALPIVMSPQGIRDSLDSFPMEYLDMKSAYQVVLGSDVLAEIEIQPRHLRLQCEREIKAKLIQLRRSYLEMGAKQRDREQLFRQSIKSFLVIMRSMLWLEGVERPKAAARVISALEEVIGSKLPHCTKVIEFRTGKPKMAETESHRLFAGYLQEVEALAQWIDKWVQAKEGGHEA